MNANGEFLAANGDLVLEQAVLNGPHLPENSMQAMALDPAFELPTSPLLRSQVDSFIQNLQVR